MQLSSPVGIENRPLTAEETETRSLGPVLAAVVLGLLLLLILRHPTVWGANDESRWDTVYSLGELGTYQIDLAPWIGTMDKVRLNDHFYSSKPPVLPALVAGEYVLVRKLSGGSLTLRGEPGSRKLDQAIMAITGYRGRVVLIIPILLFLTNLVPFALYIWLFARLTERLSPSAWVRHVTMATVALGTFITSFQVTLNNHTVGAICFFFALYLAYEALCEERREGWRLAVAGFFASMAAVTEFPAVIIPALLLVAFACTCRWRVLWWFVPFALIPLAAHFELNHLATGSWMPAYTNKAAYIYPGSAWTLNEAGNLVGTYKGIDTLWQDWPVYWFHNLFGHHGWFSLTPVLLIAAVGIFRVIIRGKQWYRILAIASILLLIYLLVIYTFFTGHRNYGGGTTGSRYLFWIIPIWLMFLPAGLECLVRWRVLRMATLVLLLLSVATVIHSAWNPWAHPWLLEVLRQTGSVTY